MCPALYRWPSVCLNAGRGYDQGAQYGKFPFVNLYTNAHLRRGRLVFAFAALAAVAFTAGVFTASPAAAKQPLPTYVSISDADMFSEPLVSIQMCFVEPINTADLPRGGDFHFEVVSLTISLGLRTVFQPNGYGLAIYPGTSPGDTNGDWAFSYRVPRAATHEALGGTIKYRVDPSGQPVPKASPPARLEGGSTPAPGSSATPVPTRRPSGTLSSSAGPSGSGGVSPTASSAGSSSDNGDSNPDILLLALLTVGAASGAGVLALFGYLLRRRVGFWMHRPPPGGPDDGADH